MSNHDPPSNPTPPTKTSTPIPILLLKTRSVPDDTYAEYLSSPSASTSFIFTPTFVPVLEHTHNTSTLITLSQLLKSGQLKAQYGGMIFTSQRAVEAWSDTVMSVEREMRDGVVDNDTDIHSGISDMSLTTATDTRTGHPFQTDILTSTPFPLYVVGPATHRALSTLISTLPDTSPFLNLHPTLHGSHTGSGAALAPLISNHYTHLHSSIMYTFHDAPRLPFIPLLGMGSENYSRRRLESDDVRLRKRPLVFLVGEVRRDVIPKYLMSEERGSGRVEVVEMEVYGTKVREGFGRELNGVLQGVGMDGDGDGMVVIVVFSPQGSGEMLREIGYVDGEGRVTQRAERRWDESRMEEEKKKERRYVIVTIGPTTRDYLKDTFGFEADVCAKKPSPEGVREGVEEFLISKGLVYQYE